MAQSVKTCADWDWHSLWIGELWSKYNTNWHRRIGHFVKQNFILLLCVHMFLHRVDKIYRRQCGIKQCLLGQKSSKAWQTGRFSPMPKSQACDNRPGRNETQRYSKICTCSERPPDSRRQATFSDRLQGSCRSPPRCMHQSSWLPKGRREWLSSVVQDLDQWPRLPRGN